MGTEFEAGLEGLESGPEASDAATQGVRGEEADAASHPSVAALRATHGDAVVHHEVVAGDEHVVFVRPEQGKEILAWLRDAPGQGYDLLTDVTAVDFGGGRPIQLVYQLWSIEYRRALRVKVELPLSALEVDSVVDLWATANWLEREVFDMFGIRFRGHPDLRRILMPENYAEGHPLRKDFPLRGRFSRVEQTQRSLMLDMESDYSPHELEVGVRDPERERAAQPAKNQGGVTPAG